MLKTILLGFTLLFTLNCFANSVGNISGTPEKGLKQVSATGHLSNVYSSEEEAKLKAPDAAIDKACGQDFLAAVYDHTFHCQPAHNGFQCKQTMKATCAPR